MTPRRVQFIRRSRGVHDAFIPHRIYGSICVGQILRSGRGWHWYLDYRVPLSRGVVPTLAAAKAAFTSAVQSESFEVKPPEAIA